MNGRTGRRLAACVLASIIFCAVLGVSAPAFAYTISGSVVDSATGLPIKDAELRLTYYNTGASAWYVAGVYASSAANGAYSLNVASDGLYHVQCYNLTDYAAQWWDKAATESLATTITVSGSSITGINFAMVGPKMPTDLTIATSSTCGYASAKISGYLTSNGAPLANKKVVIKHSTDGSWSVLGYDMTDSSGLYTYAAKPTRKTSYQAVFEEDAAYLGDDTGIVEVLPKVSLSKPTGPSSTRTTKTFTSYCYLKPFHAAGTYPVSIACQRYQSGKWVTKKTVKARASTYRKSGATYTKCTARIRLTKKGSWRIIAVHAADTLNAKTTSAHRDIKVK